jgi:hypothetical protein
MICRRMQRETSSLRLTFLVLGLVLQLSGVTCLADSGDPPDKAADKSHYNLLNPTPPSQLREMEALYENPYTVDAGHLQIETYPVGYRLHEETLEDHRVRTEGWTLMPTNLRLGILNNLDAQLALAPYTAARVTDGASGHTEKHHGFGDLVPRARVNLWGNDGGKTAGALTSFIKIPTSQDGLGNGAYEGGIIFAWGAQLPMSWWLVLTPELDVSADLTAAGYHPEGAGTAYFWHSIIGDLSGYVEFAARASAESSVPWLGTVDLGLTYMLTKNVQLDIGTRIGVTASADDINPFVGISVRF